MTWVGAAGIEPERRVLVAHQRRVGQDAVAPGFSVAMTAHAYALLDSYVYGFALQEASLPFKPETVADVARPASQQISARDYPRFVEMATGHILQPGYDFGNEFEIGLGVILDALTASIPGNRERPSLTPSS